MPERLGNLGYGALIKEVTAGTPLTPTLFFQFYKSTIFSDLKLDEDNPIAGVRSNPFNQFMGKREHTGQLTVLAEPNTVEAFFDMLLAAGNITGGGDPYTHPFTEGESNSYTMDLLKGQVVERYWGVKAESIESSWNKNKMELNIDISALGCLSVRKIATVSTTTITLDTTYDPTPNKGFVQLDLVALQKADGSVTTNFSIASSGVNADGITLTLNSSAAAFAAGDYIFLRQQVPSYSILTPFMWARTEFRFGSSASAALTAAQLQLETGSKWKLTHKFEKKGGSDRSGSYDPSSLPRLQTEGELTLKAFFDKPNILEQYLEVAGNNALVIRHFSGSNHELRITLNQLRYKMDKRELDSAKIIYEELTGRPNYNSSDGQMFDVKVINALAT